jgi:putative DNA methylase
MSYRKKLIEVALPLDAINAACSKEKSSRHGHPSTLHLWWARRPLAAARSVIFSQMVDDPSEYLSDPIEIIKERQRLFELIIKLIQWDNTTNEEVLEAARSEIRRSWARQCLDSEKVAKLTDNIIKEMLRTGSIPPLPGFHDPFSGGGALPLEAQRLGLEAHASDLNPVAVMINKAMIEIPPKFAGKPPVSLNTKGIKGGKELDMDMAWTGARGLAEDVRHYGQWMREEAEKRIGHLYPKIEVTAEMTKERPDLKNLVGQKLTVIAWIWARTVNSPNPAFSKIPIPLASTFLLSCKTGKESYVHPVIEGKHYHFTVKIGNPPIEAKLGTKLARGANFKCLLSDMPMDSDYIKAEGMAGRLGAKLMAMVAEGKRGRVYFAPTDEMESVAQSAKPKWIPSTPLAPDLRALWTPLYGLTTYGSLFTSRQLVALDTFSDLVAEAREKVAKEAKAVGFSDPNSYASAVSVYLAFAVNRMAMSGNSLVRWNNVGEKAQHCFGRQALPMQWDFAEPNFLATATGSIEAAIYYSYDPISWLPIEMSGKASQADASTQSISNKMVVSTDPPYYDNIGYADLSDFFYVWMRRNLKEVYPDLFATMAVPKTEELVATPYRHGSKEAAESFFMKGMTGAMRRLAALANQAFPVTIYYAFKQSETDEGETSSTGWETFLAAVISAGFAIDGTWPMRTEMKTRQIAMGTNALASSIILVCRQRSEDSAVCSRREFQSLLRSEMGPALRALQHGNIAPVDLAQSSIGPGMSIYSRHSKVLEADGSQMKVKTALSLINEVLDELLTEQEGELDPDSRWAVDWFFEYGYDAGPFGRADDLARAKNASVDGLVQAGIVSSGSGKVRLLKRAELDSDWDPSTDKRLTVWESTLHMIRVLESKGETACAELRDQLGPVADAARDLAYRLYILCERKGRAEDARAFNALVASWSDLSVAMVLGSKSKEQKPKQSELEL